MVHLASVGSTNDVALALAARGAPEGTVVVAAQQSAGRGRRGRSWLSPAGGNLYGSILLRPDRPQREWPELSWVVAGAVAAAAVALGARAVALKLPNDVLVGERKLSGVLLETRSVPGRPAAVVAGIGVNVVSAPAYLPGGIRRPAISLEEAVGAGARAATFLAAACAELGALYPAWGRGGADALLDKLLAAGVGIASLAAERAHGCREGTQGPGGEG